MSAQRLDEFLSILNAHAHEKAKLYDGMSFKERENQTSDPVDFGLRLATEELGEIASAITRNRYNLAQCECIDLAHTAFLLWLALDDDATPDTLNSESMEQMRTVWLTFR